MIHHEDGSVTLHHGDCIEVLKSLPDNSVDSVVTDPPYGLEFMGKDWDAPWKTAGDVIQDPASVGGFQDGNGGNPYSRSRIRYGRGGTAGKVEPIRGESTDDSHPFHNGGNRVEYGRGGEASIGFQEWCTLWATECLRVLKPGGHILAFGGSRTWHRLASAIEDAGFEIRDSIAWLYGSGFPKSLDVSKAIDKGEGIWRGRAGAVASDNGSMSGGNYERTEKGDPITEAAQQWAGWGTALKPAFEPIVVARKPLIGTVAANVLEHGTGALNIDACRIAASDGASLARRNKPGDNGWKNSSGGNNAAQERADAGLETLGRWPTNAVLDHHQAAELDRQSGNVKSAHSITADSRQQGATAVHFGAGRRNPDNSYGDSGGASRFFPTFKYTAKAPGAERPTADGVSHPTVKPLELMRWLVRLVTPPDGVVLEPFAGSGTTVEACLREGKRCIAVERETTYLPLILARISDTQLGFDLGA